ncbi:MAG TPA: Smr/MutS family protein, partial [Thermoanaerobaculia bacterium]|nr:Smr/MutS family protein [Thermoanaerobaculia bacterium]
MEEDTDEEETGWEETVELPITDVLDLHSFRPSEVADVVRDYLDAAYEKGFRDLRIIHGKGIG